MKATKTKVKKYIIPREIALLWKPNSINKKFWKKVLNGRTIKTIIFGKKGIEALVLDNDVHIEGFGHGTFHVQCEV